MEKHKTTDNSGRLFDNIMKKKGFLRDREFAKAVGATGSWVSNVRTGKLLIGDKYLVRICERMNISLKSARAQIAEGK